MTKQLFGVALVAIAVPACSALWGFDDGTLRGDPNDVIDDASLVDASSVDATVLPADANLDAATDADVPCEDGRTANPDGYFVDDESGTDNDACSRQALPCRSLTWVVDHLDATRVPFVHVAHANYTGSLSLPASARGLAIDGAWRVRLAQGKREWLPYCGSEPTRIVATSAVAITVDVADSSTDAGDASTTSDAGADAFDLSLSHFEISGKTSAAIGESLYGLRARNARLALADVTFVVAAGGTGAMGNGGTVGAPATSKSCPAATGANGSTGAAGDPAGAGSYAAGGYEPGSATVPGDVGQTGFAGTAPGQCNGLPLGGVSAGCGGAGGQGGAPGHNGAGSFGLYLAQSHASLERVAVTVLGGGAGGSGGQGGQGGAGTLGNSALCVLGNLVIAGTQGGAGGAGGIGGAGSGGPSVCVARLASTTSGEPSCFAGPGGTGAGVGADKATDGFSGPLYTEGDAGIDDTP